MRFEWDSEKDRINQRKRGGIAFESAALVFDDPHVIFCKDRIVDGEQRWHAIGAAEGAVLLVVHAYRVESDNGEEETIRIVSAREANQRERRVYFQQSAEQEAKGRPVSDCEAAGCRGRLRHRLLRHPSLDQRAAGAIPPHANRALIREAGLTVEEFARLL